MDDRVSEWLVLVFGVFVLYASIRDSGFLYSSSKGEFLLRLFGRTGTRLFCFLVGLFGAMLGCLSLLNVVSLKQRVF